MVRYGTHGTVGTYMVRYHFSYLKTWYGTVHMVRLVRTKIAAEIAAESAAIFAAILVRYHFSYLKTWYGTVHMVRLVRTKIAAEIAAEFAAISAAILVRYHFSYLKTWYGTVHMVRLVRYTWLDCYGFVRLVQCMVHSVHWLVGCSC